MDERVAETLVNCMVRAKQLIAGAENESERLLFEFWLECLKDDARQKLLIQGETHGQS